MMDAIRRIVLVSGGSFDASLITKALILLLVGLGVVRVCRRAAAAVRHALLTAMFGGLVALPLCVTDLPTVAVAVAVQGPAAPWEAASAPTASDGTAKPSSPAVAAVPDTRWPVASLAAGMRFVWALGVLMLLLRLATGAAMLWRVHRRATPWPDGQALADRLAGDVGLRRRVAVGLHASLGMPLTYGWVRPVVLMPADAPGWKGSDLTGALTHELTHVSRADWPVQLVAEFTCACYWFLPWSWVALRRLRIESERACDDAVLRRVDPSVYADQLVRFARRLSAIAAPAVLSMAGGELSTRIAAILNQRQRRGQVSARVRLATALAAMVVVAAVSPLRAVPKPPTDATLGQARSGAIPHVDATSVTPSAGAAHASFAGDPHARVSTQSGGMCPPFGWIHLTETCVSAANMTLRELVALAYGPTGLVPPRPTIVGGADWTDTARFDVVIRAGDHPPLQTFESGPLALMVQGLLSQRFALRLHHETRRLPLYALVHAPNRTGAPPLRPATPDCVREIEGLRAAAWTDLAPHLPSHPDACLGEVSGAGLTGGAVDMPQLARVLSNHVDRIVRDDTQIAGLFQLHVRWGSSRGALLSTQLQEQLGLQLVPTEGPLDVLMIDRVSWPTVH